MLLLILSLVPIVLIAVATILLHID